MKTHRLKQKRFKQNDVSDNELPLDVLVQILSNLNEISDLTNCFFVNKIWNSAASQSSLWQKFVIKRFGVHFKEKNNCDWFQIYKNFCQLNIVDDCWIQIDDLNEIISCPFCQIQLKPFEDNCDFYVECNCEHRFTISVVTEEEINRANENYSRKYENT